MMGKRFNNLLVVFVSIVWKTAKPLVDMKWDDITFGASAMGVAASNKHPTIYIQTTDKMEN